MYPVLAACSRLKSVIDVYGVFMRPPEGFFQRPAQNNHDWQKKNRESRFRLDIQNEFFAGHGAGNADLHKVFTIGIIKELVAVIHFS
jgi:hypothetical protein